jgi:hypothetical protein
MTQHVNGAPNGKRQQDSSIPVFQVERLTLSQVIALGQESSRALKNQSVEFAIQLRIRQLQDEWCDSDPQETKKREYLYHQIQAVKSLYYTMEGFIGQAQNLQHQQEQQEAQSYQESQY